MTKRIRRLPNETKLKFIPKLPDETRLQCAVRTLLNKKGRYCADGWCGADNAADAARFYRRHAKEINAMFAAYFDTNGLSLANIYATIFEGLWDTDDPLARTAHNQSLLAQLAFDHTVRDIYSRPDQLAASKSKPVS